MLLSNNTFQLVKVSFSNPAATVSSAKSLTFEFKPLGKSLMQIKKIVKYQELTLVVHPL